MPKHFTEGHAVHFVVKRAVRGWAGTEFRPAVACGEPVLETVPPSATQVAHRVTCRRCQRSWEWKSRSAGGGGGL